MDYNLHTHTFRCGHAQGEDEEYVLSIEKGKLLVDKYKLNYIGKPNIVFLQ